MYEGVTMDNLTLLEDYNPLDKYSLFEDKQGNKKFYLRGVFSRVDIPNKNKRIYSRPVMEDAINEVQGSIKNRALVGELDHPPTPKINVKGISHVITNLAIAPDGAVLGEAEVIDEHLRRLMEANVRLGVSTRGLGAVEPAVGLGEGFVSVKPGYRIKAIDVVFDPSAGSYPDYVVEGTEEHKIVVGSTIKFRKVWEDIFGR
jgi:hypothetical protein